MRRLALFTIVFGVSLAGKAAELTRSQSEFFENKVRPVLANHCYKCHSQTAEKVMKALMQMKKLDIAELKKAAAGR